MKASLIEQYINLLNLEEFELHDLTISIDLDQIQLIAKSMLSILLIVYLIKLNTVFIRHLPSIKSCFKK